MGNQGDGNGDKSGKGKSGGGGKPQSSPTYEQSSKASNGLQILTGNIGSADQRYGSGYGKPREQINTITGYDAEERSKYNKLKEVSEPLFTPPLSHMVVTPKDKDYEKGFYHRHFFARYDSELASEITKARMDKVIKKTPTDIYTFVSFKWILKDGYEYDGIPTTMANTAKNQNEMRVSWESEKLPQLKKTIKDFDEFVR